MTLIVAGKCSEGLAISADGRATNESGKVLTDTAKKLFFSGTGVFGDGGRVDTEKLENIAASFEVSATAGGIAKRLFHVEMPFLLGLEIGFVVAGLSRDRAPDLHLVVPAGIVRLEETCGFIAIGGKNTGQGSLSLNLFELVHFSRKRVQSAAETDSHVGGKIVTYKLSLGDKAWTEVT